MKYGFLTLFSLMLAVGIPARATTARSLGLNDLLARSTWVVQGVVVNKASYYDSKQGMIYTKIKLKVSKTYKGKQKRLVTFTLPGGTVNGRVQVVFGVPVLHLNERLIVFLKPVGRFVGAEGLGQGIFIVDPGTNRVFRRLNKVRLIGEQFKFPTDLPGFEQSLLKALQNKTRQK